MVLYIKKWIENIAVTVIIASIIEMLLPSGNIKKYIKIVLGLYILFSIISPFVNNKELYSLDIENEINKYTPKIYENSNNKELTKKVDQNLEDIYTNVFEDKITETIEKYGFNVRSILIDASFDSSKEDIGIKNIKIVLSSKNANFNKKDKIKENNEVDNEDNKIIINSIEEVDIKINKSNNIKEKDESIKISTKEIDELIIYLSDYYDLKEDIFEIKAY